MIPNKSKLDVQSTLEGEDVEMTLDPTAHVYFMKLFTDLYSDPILAIIREYSTNGYDAHIEAGVARPIEVTLPNRMTSTLSIRDYGKGLNAKDIREIYSRYGASTKRETNNQVGAMGLGCKSGLTYSDQFTVISIKDGIRTVVTVSRNAEGGGTMSILEEEPTDDASGTEIVIPTRSHQRYEFTSTANDFFRFWPEGSVLVNGEEPEKIHGIEIADGIEAFQDQYNGGIESDYVVMGNVPYPVDLELPVKLVAHVPIGAVDFPPPREALMMNARTTKVIDKIKSIYEEKVQGIVQARIDATETRADALKALREVIFLTHRGQAFTWNDEEIPMEFAYKVEQPKDGDDSIPAQAPPVRILGRAVRRGRGMGYFEVRRSVPIFEAIDKLWVVNFSNARWAAGTRRKFNGYIAQQIEAGKLPEGIETSGTIVVTENAPPNAAWIDSAKIIDWADVKKYRLPVDGGSREIVKGTYDVYRKDANDHYRHHSRYPASDIDLNKPLFYCTDVSSDDLTVLRNHYPDLQVAIVPHHRLGKFCRTFPSAIAVRDAIRPAVKSWWRGLSQTQKTLIRWERGDQSGNDVADWFKTSNKIIDPELSEVVKLKRAQERHQPIIKEYNSVYRRYLNKPALTFDGLDERYPLLESGYADIDDPKSVRHALSYVNAVYKEEIGD